MANIIWLQDLNMNDVERVGGKNASLGEMISGLSDTGVDVPGGFATTADAFQTFLSESGLHDKIYQALGQLDVNDVNKLREVGEQIRSWVMQADFSASFEQDIRDAFSKMQDGHDISVAVRSSATAEDLPDASFAGQQETFLNVVGIEAVLEKIKAVFASLYNDRAISYRVHHNFEHEQVAISAGVQRMVRSDLGASGVAFSLDTESGFDEAVFVTASYGLGETVVQGSVNPDEFYLYKPALAAGKSAILRRNLGSKMTKMIFAPAASDKLVDTVPVEESARKQFSLSDEDLVTLAKMVVQIEQHYGRPMDVEWAKDGQDGRIYIVQARPETVCSRESQQVIERFTLENKGRVLIEGRSIGQRIGQGTARVLSQLSEMDQVQPGDVLVTDMTDPDWEPVMKRASAIVTNRGGRTCHAAIIARELGIPAVVGTGSGTEMIQSGKPVTVSCAEGETGFVYEGLQSFDVQRIEVGSMPDLPFKISMNVGNPDRAFAFSRLPHAGVGLARLEFIINKMIGIHPQALLGYEALKDASLKACIRDQVAAYESPVEYYIERLREGIATIGAAFAPQTVIVRLSDFKSNEYANLLGGPLFEPHEENPMLGFRGAARYLSDSFKACFELECEAIKRVRNDMGLTNVQIMVPFVRTLSEAENVIALLAENGLARGDNGLQIMMMCELPSNAVLADEFLKHFDGFSIGSNDMTQLTLGLDRDSALIAEQFDERDPAVKVMLKQAIAACKKANKYVGICGQGPSDHPDLAEWLMQQGISAVSLNPDTVVETWMYLAEHLSTHSAVESK